MRLPSLRFWILASLREAGWAPALVFVLHVVACRGFAAYLLFPPLDLPMHFLGGVAISFFFGRSYRIAERMGLLGKPVRWLYFVTVAALAGTATIVWEFAEFLSDRYLGTHAQLGLEDTLSDMLLGCLGSFAFLAGFRLRRSARDLQPRGFEEVRMSGPAVTKGEDR